MRTPVVEFLGRLLAACFRVTVMAGVYHDMDHLAHVDDKIPAAISPQDAARLLGVRTEWIYSLIWRHKIAATKSAAGTWLIPREAVEARWRLMEARRDAEQAGR